MNFKPLIGISFAVIAIVVGILSLNRSTYYSVDDIDIVPDSIVAGVTTSVTSASASEIKSTQSVPQTSGTKSLAPKTLKIPSLGINTNVQQVGLKANGAMANPVGFKEVGWYKLGTVPGEIGSAVMAGHVDNAISLPGVFKNLGKMKIGDSVYVTRSDGKELQFKVISVEEYPYKAAPSKKIFATSDGAYLNLITCSGKWLSSEKSYDKRLVVYTKLVE